jgi:tRNA(adenine34) deaminase
VTSPDAAMHAALEVARAAPSSGDVPVGAVVLDRTGATIAMGHNEREVAHDATAAATKRPWGLMSGSVVIGA